jgi:aminoglycoside 3-N-acetyltransferase
MTLARIADGLQTVGVRPSDRLLVHASLSAFGYVAGGAQTVVAALRAAVGPDGLLIMPAFTGQLSDPANWSAPPVPAGWWPIIRSQTPAFDPLVTPTRGMGAVCELVRTSPGAVRGPHPTVSFTALGRGAARIVAPHAVQAWLGEGSPLQRLYDLDAKVLFLGVGFGPAPPFILANIWPAR